MTKPTCGAKTKAGTPCRRPAGWGTDHPGDGRCKLHGGASLRGAAHPGYKHGRYAKYHPEQIADKVAAFAADQNPTDILDELALLRGLLAAQLEKGNALADDEFARIRTLADDIRRYVDTIVKMRNATALTAAELAFIAARIPEIVSRYIDDPDTQRRFVAELLSVTSPATTDQHQLDDVR